MAVVFKYKVGDIVILSNPRTRYGMNGISHHDWGKKVTIDRLCGGIPEGPTYMVITNSYERKHVVETMLSPGSGPW